MRETSAGSTPSLMGNMDELPIWSSLPGAGQDSKRQRWRFSSFWWLVTAFWLFIALASALEMSLLQSANIGQALVVALVRLVPWIFLTPLVVWVSSVYTLERSTWKRSLWVHLAVCALSLAIVGVICLFEPALALSGSAGPGGAEAAEPGAAANGVCGAAADHLPVAHLLGVGGSGARAALLRAHQSPRTARGRAGSAAGPGPAAGAAHAAQSAFPVQHAQLHRLAGARATPGGGNDRGPERPVAAHARGFRPAGGHACARSFISWTATCSSSKSAFGERLRVEKQIDVCRLGCRRADSHFAAAGGKRRQARDSKPRSLPESSGSTAEHVGEALRLEVSDNGRGPAAAAEGPLKEGVGLSNTRSRLKELYGERASLNFVRARRGAWRPKSRFPGAPLWARRRNRWNCLMNIRALIVDDEALARGAHPEVAGRGRGPGDHGRMQQWPRGDRFHPGTAAGPGVSGRANARGQRF